MSDHGRKNISDQVEQKVTPDSQKSYTQQAGEKTSGLADRAKAAITPDSQKGVTQRAADTGRGLTDETHETHETHNTHGEGVMGKVKNALGMDDKK